MYYYVHGDRQRSPPHHTDANRFRQISHPGVGTRTTIIILKTITLIAHVYHMILCIYNYEANGIKMCVH